MPEPSRITREELHNLPLGEVISYRGQHGVIFQKHGEDLWVELGFVGVEFANRRPRGYMLYEADRWQPSGEHLNDGDFVNYEWSVSIQHSDHIPCRPEIRAVLGFLGKDLS